MLQNLEHQHRVERCVREVELPKRPHLVYCESRACAREQTRLLGVRPDVHGVHHVAKLTQRQRDVQELATQVKDARASRKGGRDPAQSLPEPDAVESEISGLIVNQAAVAVRDDDGCRADQRLDRVERCGGVTRRWHHGGARRRARSRSGDSLPCGSR